MNATEKTIIDIEARTSSSRKTAIRLAAKEVFLPRIREEIKQEIAAKLAIIEADFKRQKSLLREEKRKLLADAPQRAKREAAAWAESTDGWEPPPGSME